MRFRVSPTQSITEEMVQQAYLSGMDRVSWQVQATAEGGELSLQRAASDSANLHIPWPVEGYGQLTLTSASLMERTEPYRLPLELARGAIVQVRNQLSEWQLIGLTVPETVTAKLNEAVQRFSWAVVVQDDDLEASAELAEKALRAALNAGDYLTVAYARQALSVRRRIGGSQPEYLGVDLGGTLLDRHVAGHVLKTFNAAEVPIAWRDTETADGDFLWGASDAQIAWCHANKLHTLAGPLLMLDPTALPDSFYLFDDDFDSVQDYVSSFIRATVQRYRGQVDGWICAGRVNAAAELAITEQERLQLVAQTVELVRSLDPGTPLLVSFDQPWAEYMRQRESDFPPLHFADALIRAGLDLAGLMLEINVGYSPSGTLLRHPLEFNRLLDIWSLLGVPLWLSLSAPSTDAPDPLAIHHASVAANTWTPTSQQAWVSRFVPLALAKPMVQGVVWNQLCDAHPHGFPNAGLFDARGRTKPVMRRLTAIRRKYLK
ncbi:MAG: hypothetical protein LLF97_07565 [Planctomycetaceae bacterium]|nr:hypothetical protein [Planctomycetaceae bacterium]